VYMTPTQPRSIGGVLDDGLRLWRAAFAKAWLISLMGQALMAIPLLIYWTQFQGTAGARQAPFGTMFSSPGLALAYFVFSLAAIGFHNAVIAQTDSRARSAGETVGQSLSIGFRLLGRAFLLGVLVAIAVALPLGLLFFALVGVSTVGRLVFGAVAFVVVCYAVGKIILGAVVLIVEDKGAFDSLRRSWTLTAGHWWRVATILTVLVIVVIVLFLVIGVIAGLVAASMGSTAGVPGMLIQVISLLGNTLISPLYSAVLVAIYYDLKLRKEGADLAGRVSALAV
jgi:hypothetical protein